MARGKRGDWSQGVIAAALVCVQTGRPFSMFGDGSSERDYLYIGDLVDVVCGLLGRRDVPRIVNVGSGCGATVADIVAVVESVTGESLTLDVLTRRVRVMSPAVVLDTSQLQSLEPFDALPLHDGIASTWTALVEGEFAPAASPTQEGACRADSFVGSKAVPWITPAACSEPCSEADRAVRGAVESARRSTRRHDARQRLGLLPR